MFRRTLTSVALALTLIALAGVGSAHAQQPQTIIESFVQAESRLREALTQHTFKREVVLQTISSKGQVTGEYVRNSEFVFDDRGNRIERVTYHPPSSIREMRITNEDIQDLAGAQLLGVDIAESGKYNFNYRGEELLNGMRVYVLYVEPATKPNPQRMSERYFRGSVWIDAATFQIVKVRGIVEPQGKQRFPLFETWRESAGATFAFPSRTEADDVLHFPNRNVNYRIRVRYYDYKLFVSTVSVKELDEPGN
ncbi:MAG TPA: hypothetical protein VJS13_14950 [Pyrinomonadaceae bacterium]|nr:hypothetical protein [Pyrinomonadaceae bacterium]